MHHYLRFSPAILTGVGALAIISINCELRASPIIPGLHQNHPLNEVQKGQVLIQELRCASCHDNIASHSSAPAPDLRDVKSRIKPEFLKKFILDPAKHDPGTFMPDVLNGRSPEEKEQLAASLSAYLLSLRSEPVESTILPKDTAQDGQKLFHEAGCIACHSPRDGNADAKSHPGNVGLDHVAEKYHFSGLTAFLQEPLKVRPDGRMPDMRLSRSEAELLAAFMIGSESASSETTAAPAEAIAAGKKAFSEMRCIACHQVDDTAPMAALNPEKSALDLTAGCLASSPGNAPNYHLNEEQRKAIRSALTTPKAEPKPGELVKMRVTQLNCIACHQRDDYGGVRPELDGYFHSTEEALGNEARIPPPLTHTGAKLRREWMHKVLYEGESVRPYMTTRMPQYGNAALDGLIDQFTAADPAEPFEFAPLEKESKTEMQNAAHMLLGDQGLNCIACHNYNGKESPSMKGLDLMTSYQRLQPGWLNQFLGNPAKFRPGIIMPSYWPDGKAVQTEILDGNADQQIRALWHNFSLGRSARDPSGLRAEDPELIVENTIRTYRGRSDIAGYRGIAVGFPTKLNYAFNARTGALSGIWSGKFITVGWRGQGSGNFSPTVPAIQLAQDVAFLSEAKNPWPLKPERTKENPVSPDPTYPTQHGYAFLGYTIGENGLPTFRYRSGEVTIADTSIAVRSDSAPILRRTLSFTTAKPTTLHFRALTGKVQAVSKSSYKNELIELSLTASTAQPTPDLRKSATPSAIDELILSFDLPAGTSTQTLDYAPVR